MVDYIGVMLEALAAQPASIKLATEDMKPACRQIALRPAAVRFAIAAVFDPVGNTFRDFFLVNRHPVVLYTDATDDRQPQRLAGVVPFFQKVTSCSTHAGGSPNHGAVVETEKSLFGKLELVAPLWALDL